MTLRTAHRAIWAVALLTESVDRNIKIGDNLAAHLGRSPHGERG